ncbi:MAG: hypothetical protein IJ292_03705 [Clostridia bacterium]|nr:hypothetical protein [Clostridia bacterium]
MKAKIKIKYRKEWMYFVCVRLFLELLLILMTALVSHDQHYILSVLCSMLFITDFASICLRLNYGITINEKRVVAIEKNRIKVLRYDDIASIVIEIANESVVAYVKMKEQKEHIFVWDNIFLSSRAVYPSKNKIKIDKEFVENSIASLSPCPKVTIKNLYSQE